MNTRSKLVSTSLMFAVAGTIFAIGCHSDSGYSYRDNSNQMADESNTSVPTYAGNGTRYDDSGRQIDEPSSNLTRTPDEVRRDRDGFTQNERDRQAATRYTTTPKDDVYTRDVQAGSHGTTSSNSYRIEPSRDDTVRSHDTYSAAERDRRDSTYARVNNSDWDRGRNELWKNDNWARSINLQSAVAMTPPDNAYPVHPYHDSWRYSSSSSTAYSDTMDGRSSATRTYWENGNEYRQDDQRGTYRVNEPYATRYHNTDREYVPDRVDRNRMDHTAARLPDEAAPASPDKQYDNSTVRSRDYATNTNGDTTFYPVMRDDKMASTPATDTDRNTIASKPDGFNKPAPGAEKKPMTNMTEGAIAASGMSVDQLTADWPQEQKDAIAALTAKYGQPAEATKSAVMWKNNGKFLCTVVLKDAISHDFPMHHNDFIIQTISYKVPADKVSDLAAFDGSLMVDRTKGTLSARCDSEEHNILALNIANDIVTGSKTVAEARSQLSQTAMAFRDGQNDKSLEQLNFEPQMNAGDPDHPLDTRASTTDK